MVLSFFSLWSTGNPRGKNEWKFNVISSHFISGMWIKYGFSLLVKGSNLYPCQLVMFLSTSENARSQLLHFQSDIHSNSIMAVMGSLHEREKMERDRKIRQLKGHESQQPGYPYYLKCCVRRKN